MQNYDYNLYRLEHAEQIKKSRERQEGHKLMEEQAQENQSNRGKRKRR